MTTTAVPRRLNGLMHFFFSFIQINGPLFIVTGRLKQQYRIIMYYYYTGEYYYTIALFAHRRISNISIISRACSTAVQYNIIICDIALLYRTPRTTRPI